MKIQDKKGVLIFKLIAVIFFIIVSCNSSVNRNGNFKVEKANTKCFYKDKNVIKHYIREWLKQGKLVFPKEYFYEDTTNLLIETFEIDTIIYAPDNCKLFSTIIMKSSTKLFNEFEKQEWGSDSLFFYGSRAVLGYRKNPKSKWNIQFFDKYIGNLFYDRNSAQKYIRDSFFYRIKTQYFVKRDKLKNMNLVKINSGVIEKSFWKSVVWDSISFKKGYFPFELNNLGEPIRTTSNQYPDSLHCY